MTAEADRSHGPEVYIWLSIILLLPVLLTPVALMSNTSSPVFGVDFEARWLLIAGCLFLIITAADSTLFLLDRYHRNNTITFWFALNAGFWVFAASVVVPYTVYHPAEAQMLAILFALHAWRSGSALWRRQSQWWLWYAWWRDICCSIGMLLWLSFWPGY